MTLLVGILCTNGAVIAADQQTTHGNFAVHTIGQQATKIRSIADDTLYAGSGPLGLAQQYAHIIENEHHQFKNRNFHSLAPLLQKKMRDLLDPAFVTAGHASRVIGQAAQSDVILSSLLATVCKDGLVLWEISQQCGFEALTAAGVSFVCVGSGKSNADPFLRFIWDVYFPGTARPNVSEGSLIAYWTVRTVIDSRTSGVGYNPDVFVIEQINKTYKSRQLSKDDLIGHDELIGAASGAMRSIQARMAGREKMAADEVPLPTLDDTKKDHSK
jgi:20S proteasome alpha/beta subunit